MKKTLLAAALLLLGASLVQAQDENTKIETLDSTVVSAFRAGSKTPVAFTEVSKEELGATSVILRARIYSPTC